MHKIYSKLDIADEFLDGAIDAFLKSKQFFVALNLAGVAEELYGKAVRLQGGKNSQTNIIELAKAIARFDGDSKSNDRDLYSVSVMHKNSIKHLDSEEDYLIEMDIEAEARSTIFCALSNHGLLNRQCTPTIQKFFESYRVPR